MTDQELKDLVASTSESVKLASDAQIKTSENINRISEKMEKRAIEFNETMKKRDKEFNEKIKNLNLEINGKIDKLHATLSGVGQNNGDVAEDFFFNGLNDKMEIGKIKFSSIDRNVSRRTRRLQDEFDIVITNTDSIVIFEVKYKYHPNDVEKLYSKIKNYKLLFPLYNQFNFYGGIAALSMPDDSLKKAMEYGFFALTQSGNNLKLLNDNVFKLNTAQKLSIFHILLIKLYKPAIIGDN